MGGWQRPPPSPPARPTLRIRGTDYPVLLPTLRDPRLHLAAVIISLQILGQVAFDFQLSIAQILVSLLHLRGHRGRDHVPPAARDHVAGERAPDRQRRRVHPARPRHGARRLVEHERLVDLRRRRPRSSILSKYVIMWRGSHFFNPSNFGLVLCFLLLGAARAEPLALLVGADVAVARARARDHHRRRRSRSSRGCTCSRIAVTFWLTFATGIGVLAATGHAMTARWHLGPITGGYFWRVLVLSPEVMVFLFFMITDPKTTPKSRVARWSTRSSVGLLAALLIAPQATEFATKVALLGALGSSAPRGRCSMCCAPIAAAHRLAGAAAPGSGRGGASARRRRRLALVVLAGIPARPERGAAAPLVVTGRLPQIDDPAVARRLDRSST